MSHVTPCAIGWAARSRSSARASRRSRSPTSARARTSDWEAERAAYPWAFIGARLDAWPWHVHAFVDRRRPGVLVVDTGVGPSRRMPPWAEQAPDPWAGRDPSRGRARGAHATCTPITPAARSWTATSRGSRTPATTLHRADWVLRGGGRRRGLRRTRCDGAARGARHALLEDADDGDRPRASACSTRRATRRATGASCSRAETRRLLLTGDLLHHPVQVAHPRDRPSSHDEDPESGAAVARRAAGRAPSDAVGTWGCRTSRSPFGRVEDGRWRPAEIGTPTLGRRAHGPIAAQGTLG